MIQSYERALGWLYEKGGPVIRLRLIREFGIDAAAEAATLAEVLQLPEIQFWLDNLAISKRVHDGHCNRLENIAGKLHALGLAGETKIFDPVMDAWKDQLAASRDDTAFFAGYRRAMLSACFYMLGYDCQDLREVANHRLGVLYEFCRQGDYNIYLPENYYGDLPKPRAGKPLVRPDLYQNGQVMLPSIYDVIWFPVLYGGENRQRIDVIINYILQDAYQNGIRPGYGNIREGKGHYYGMGWSVHVPGFNGMPPDDPRELVMRMELLAPFAPAVSSELVCIRAQLSRQFSHRRGSVVLPACVPDRTG